MPVSGISGPTDDDDPSGGQDRGEPNYQRLLVPGAGGKGDMVALLDEQHKGNNSSVPARPSSSPMAAMSVCTARDVAWRAEANPAPA